MIDSPDDILEPVLRIFGRFIGGVLRFAFEVFLKALPDIFGSIFDYYADPLQRRGWSAWRYVPVALLYALLTIVVPAGLAFVGGFVCFRLLLS